jgi:hypothetical protein
MRAGASTRHVRTTVRRPSAFARPPPPEAEPSTPPPAPRTRDTGSLLDRHPPAPIVTVTHERSITGELAEQLWDAYQITVGPLAELAVLKHVDPRHDVLGYLANQRITKLVAWQGNVPVGLGMVTNHLEDVVEISPAFLRARYPDFAARDAIYVGMLVMVVPGVRGMTVFSRIYTELWNVPARAAGILVYDICEFNRLAFATDDLSKRIASNFPNSSIDVLDRQTWYVAHLPEALPETPPQRSTPNGRQPNDA